MFWISCFPFHKRPNIQSFIEAVHFTNELNLVDGTSKTFMKGKTAPTHVHHLMVNALPYYTRL